MKNSKTHNNKPSVKIVHIIIGLNVGGAELMLKRLALSQLNDGIYDITVISLTSLGKVGQQLNDKGIQVKYLGMKSFFHLATGFIRLFKILSQKRPCIVQTWMYHADLIGGVAAKLAGCSKIIWGIRNTDTFYGRGLSRSTAVLLKACAVLSSIIPHTIVCVAREGKKAHIVKGYKRKKMMVIGNGFDTKKFKSKKNIRHKIRDELGIKNNHIVVGSIGRYNEYKDHKNFIQSAGKVALKDENALFLLVGQGVSLENKFLSKWIEDTGFPDRFILLGERSDIPSILNAIDIFCLHSISEGFPNVLGEAMSVGLPSVVTDVGDAGLLMGDAGLLVPPRDSKALSRSVNKLIQQPEKRLLLGTTARKRIKKNFSISIIKNQYDELYKRVLST